MLIVLLNFSRFSESISCGKWPLSLRCKQYLSLRRKVLLNRWPISRIKSTSEDPNTFLREVHILQEIWLFNFPRHIRAVFLLINISISLNTLNYVSIYSNFSRLAKLDGWVVNEVILYWIWRKLRAEGWRHTAWSIQVSLKIGQSPAYQYFNIAGFDHFFDVAFSTLTLVWRSTSVERHFLKYKPVK